VTLQVGGAEGKNVRPSSRMKHEERPVTGGRRMNQGEVLARGQFELAQKKTIQRNGVLVCGKGTRGLIET